MSAPQHPIFSLTDGIDRPYYFGIGGIGDFLLLMASFYDSIEPGSVDVVFVANNMKPLRDMVAEPKENDAVQVQYFDRVNRFWFFPRQSFPLDPRLWELLQSDQRCQGTGVTPKEFKYIEDWNECGKTNVFEHYDVQRLPIWARKWPLSKDVAVTIQPFGGADDPTKVKRISDSELRSLVIEEFADVRCTIIGSPDEIRHIAGLGLPNSPILISDIRMAMKAIRQSTVYVGTDSWGKTMAALAGVPEIIVYKNRYINATPQQMFGQDVDPGDYVFLHDWGFEFREES